MSALTPSLGVHPRVLRITIDPDRIAVEVQDPKNPSHVDRWQYGSVTILRIFPLTRLTGPEPVQLQLINPDVQRDAHIAAE